MHGQLNVKIQLRLKSLDVPPELGRYVARKYRETHSEGKMLLFQKSVCGNV